MNDNIVVEETEHKLTLRQLQRRDYADIISIMSSVYGEKWPLSEKKFFSQLDAFPEGQICIEDHGTVIAAAFPSLWIMTILATITPMTKLPALLFSPPMIQKGTYCTA